MKKAPTVYHQFGLFGFVPPRLKKRITPERMEEARREIERTGWKPNAKTMSKVLDQMEILEQADKIGSVFPRKGSQRPLR